MLVQKEKVRFRGTVEGIAAYVVNLSQGEGVAMVVSIKDAVAASVEVVISPDPGSDLTVMIQT